MNNKNGWLGVVDYIEGILLDDIEWCSICGKQFTKEEWDERHSDEDGEDCHEYCCPICNK